MKYMGDEMNQIEYESSKKAWMNSFIFENWLKKINIYFNAHKRKIIHLMDNAPSHIVKKEFSNIEILKLPKNSTSLTQPLDQGIIRSFKNFYKKGFMKEIHFMKSNDTSKKNFETLVSEFKL